MMGGPFLDHHGDPAAELVIATLDRQRMPLEQEVKAAADIQERDIVLSQLAELQERLRADGRVVGVDARHLVGVRGRPVVLVDAPPAHADEGRLLRQAMLLGQERIPRVPRFTGVRRDEGDVKPAAKQLDLGLRLVVPVTALPRPGIPGSRHLRSHHDAPPLAFGWAPDPVFFARGPCERGDAQARLVHHVVVTFEAVVPRRLRACEGRRWFRRDHVLRAPENRRDENCRETGRYTKISNYVHAITP